MPAGSVAAADVAASPKKRAGGKSKPKGKAVASRPKESVVGMCALHGKECQLTHSWLASRVCKDGYAILRGHFRQIRKNAGTAKWKSEKHSFKHRQAQWRSDKLHLLRPGTSRMERHRTFMELPLSPQVLWRIQVAG